MVLWRWGAHESVYWVRCVLDHDEGPREESLRLPLGLWPAAEFFLQERYNKNLTALRIFAVSRDRNLFTA